MRTYGTGKAGQFAKGEADRHFQKIYGRAIGGVGAFGFIGGVLVGMWLVPAVFRYIAPARRVPQYVYFALIAIALIAAVVTARLLFTKVLRSLDKLARLRVAALSGGQAEAVVALTLSGLDDNWHLFNGVAMKGGGDIDHVLIGPGGLFALSTKSARGLYEIDESGRLTLNGELSDHIVDARRRAMQLRNWLEAMLHNNPAVKSIPWVQPVLMVPLAYVSFPAKLENVWVMSERELYSEADVAKRNLRAAEVDGCVEILQRLTGWPLRVTLGSGAGEQQR